MRAPEASSSSTSNARSPTISSRPACSGPAAYRCLPSTVTIPYLSAFMRFHVTTSKRVSGSASSALRSPRGQVRLATSLAVVVLVAQREAPLEQPGVERRHAPARSAPARTACGAPRRPGTPRRPSRGPRTRCRTRIRTRNAPGTTGTGASASPARTSCAPRPRRHADTIRGGTPPSHSKMSRSAWHAHSAFSPGISWLGPTFEYGKSSTNRRMRDTSPRNLTSTPHGIGLRLARMPHQVEVAGLALRGELAPQLRDLPRHGRQRHLRPVLVTQTLPYPGRGMPLLAPRAAILREPLPESPARNGR